MLPPNTTALAHPRLRSRKDDNPYSSWWENINATKRISMVVIVDDNARNHCNNKTDSTVSRSHNPKPGSPPSSWNPTKDSVVGFATNKNRWGSPKREQVKQVLRKKHLVKEEQEEGSCFLFTPEQAPPSVPVRQVTNSDDGKVTLSILQQIRDISGVPAALEDASPVKPCRRRSLRRKSNVVSQAPPVPRLDESPTKP
jgi:hypothetical protein